MERQEKKLLNDSEKQILQEKYLGEGMSKEQAKKRIEFVLNNMVVPNVQV